MHSLFRLLTSKEMTRIFGRLYRLLKVPRKIWQLLGVLLNTITTNFWASTLKMGPQNPSDKQLLLIMATALERTKLRRKLIRTRTFLNSLLPMAESIKLKLKLAQSRMRLVKKNFSSETMMLRPQYMRSHRRQLHPIPTFTRGNQEMKKMISIFLTLERPMSSADVRHKHPSPLKHGLRCKLPIISDGYPPFCLGSLSALLMALQRQRNDPFETTLIGTVHKMGVCKDQHVAR